MLLLHFRILVIFQLRCTSACAHKPLVATCWELGFPADGHVDGRNHKAHMGRCQHAVTAGAGAGRSESDGTCGVTYKPFPFLIPSQFPSASKTSVFTQHAEGWKLERRLLLMQFSVPLRSGKELEMRVVLPSWLGNSGCQNILSLLHFNIYCIVFQWTNHQRLIIALKYLPEILQRSQIHGCSIVRLRARKFL